MSSENNEDISQKVILSTDDSVLNEDNTVIEESELNPFDSAKDQLKEIVLASVKNIPDQNYTKIEQIQPNFGGIQINIKNLHLDVNSDLKTEGHEINEYLSGNEDFRPTNKDFFFLLQNENRKPFYPSEKSQSLKLKLNKIVRKYYNGNYDDTKQKRVNNNIKHDIRPQSIPKNSFQNSPMLIKLLRNEELWFWFSVG